MRISTQKPFNEISGVVTELQNALTCAARVFELMEEEAEVSELPEAKVLQNAQGRCLLSMWIFPIARM